MPPVSIVFYSLGFYSKSFWLLAGLFMGPFLVSSHPLTACDSPTPWDSHETSNTKRIIQCNIGIFRPMSILYYRAVAKTPQNILLEGQ